MNERDGGTACVYRPRCSRAVGFLLIASTMAAVLVGTGAIHRVSAAVEAARSKVVFVDAQGTCPRIPSGESMVCRRTRAGNGITSSFELPNRPWGVAYAFNCGRKPGDFYVVVGLPAMDGQMPETGFDRKGRSGRGYHMETGKGIATLKTLPDIWRHMQNLEIASTCTWHVRAVLGTASVVALHVPPIPARRYAHS